jgi:hypothetical protein
MLRHFIAKKVWAFAATVALVMWGLLGVAIPAAAQVQTAVEYVSLSYDDYGFTTYFVTSFPDEIAALDAGAFDWGWQRTGQTFNVWSGPASGAVPTCRFYNTTVGSHFYTPYAAECTALQANPIEDWQYEGIAFYWQVPDENGNCPMGTTILYRLYNNDNEFPVHRFTTSTIVFNHMLIAEGWVSEGDSRTFASACVPSSTATSES